MEVYLQSAAIALVKQKLLTAHDALRHQNFAAKESQRLIPYLATHNIIKERTVAEALALHFNLSFIDLHDLKETSTVDNIINKRLLHQHSVLPLFFSDNQLFIALDDPSQLEALQAIKFHTGLNVTPMVAETTKLTDRINQLLHKHEHQDLNDFMAALPSINSLDTSISNATDTPDDAPVVKFVNRILHQAIEEGASDIHFEPYDNLYRIRYRQDGLLHEVATPPPKMASRIAARLKILSNLDIAERRAPQDGRFSISGKTASPIDCRISTCPTTSGEKIVVRLLNTGFTTQPTIESLQLNLRDKSFLIKALTKPQGLILVTGPTGSGKSMTLYAALNQLNTEYRNISTAEDPVEMKLRGINQVQVHSQIGLTFTTILRAFLRQDPDVLMIGEIRDFETAEIAIKASQTGHLVLSTLHTNSAAESILRFIQIGIPSFHLVNSLRLIIAQRLVRKLCEHCKCVNHNINQKSLYDLDEALFSTPKTIYEAQGCSQCVNGYRGRIALFEVMPITARLKQMMLMPDKKIDDIVQCAQQEGMLTIKQAGFMHVLAGLTTLSEVHRVT